MELDKTEEIGFSNHFLQYFQNIQESLKLFTAKVKFD